MATAIACTIAAAAGEVYWTNIAGGNWSHPANWNLNVLPGTADTVLVTAPGSYTVTQDVSAVIAGLVLGDGVSSPTLTNGSRTLSISGLGVVRTKARFGLGGGVLSGGGNLVIEGVGVWTGGNLGNSTGLGVAANGELEITGSDVKLVYGGLTNYGSVSVTGPGALGFCAGVVENRGVFALVNDQPLYQGGYCGPSVFVNTGLLRKSGGTGTNQFSGVPLANSGVVEVQQGWISFNSGTVFVTGTQFTGAGTNLLDRGSVTLEGIIDSDNLELAGATLLGTNTIRGVMRWTSGGFAATTVLAVDAEAQLEISGPDAKFVRGVLSNRGRVTLTGSAALGMCAGTVENLGLFEMMNDQSIYAGSFCGPSSFVNAGVLRKAAGNATNQFAGVPLLNTGVVEAQGGWISFASGSSFENGTQFLGAGTNLLNQGSVWFKGNIVSTNAELAGANLYGTNTLRGFLRWTGGNIDNVTLMTIAPDGQLEITGPAIKYLGGSLTNEGLVRLTGPGALGMCAGRVYNLAAFELENDQPVYLGGYCGPAYFVNTGVLRKTAGNATNLFSGVPLLNTGLVEAQRGWISFASGSSFETGTQFLGAGTNLLNQGSVWFKGNIVSANAELAGANLYGSNTLRGFLRWTGGNIDNVTLMTIAPDGQLEITGPAIKYLGGSLTNEGLVRLTGPGALGVCAGRVYNLAAFELENDQPVYLAGYCGPAYFFNAGVLRKTAGNATNQFAGVPLLNTGVVEAQRGWISFASGSSFETGTQFLGAGTNLLNQGNVWFKGIIVSTNAELAGADLFGTNTLRGFLRWTAGNIDNVTLMTIAPDGQLEITGPAIKYLGGSLTNEGLVRLTGPGALGMCAGRVYNLAAFELENDQPVYLAGYCGPAYFFNAGVLRKTAGNATNQFAGVPFSNAGTIEVGSGTLAFDAGLVQSEGRTRLAGGNISSSKTLEFNGGVLCGAGDLYAHVNNRGEVNPGQGIGAITVHGNYTHHGTVHVELGGVTPGTLHDQLAVTGHATLRGALNVCLAPGYRPQEGDAFQVLTWATRTDYFRKLQGLDLGGGKYLTPNYGPTGLTLQTISGPTNLYQFVIAPAAEATFQLRYTCLPGEPYVIEASEHLTNDWVPLVTNSSPAGVLDYVDLDAPHYAHRFYRVRTLE